MASATPPRPGAGLGVAVAAIAIVTVVAVLLAGGQQPGSTPGPGPASAPTSIGPTIAAESRRPASAAPGTALPGASPPGPSGGSGTPFVLIGAGDIASCSSTGDVATARLLDGQDGTVFTLGDNAYDRGSTEEFRRCYDPSWGRQLARTRPAPGNHEYETRDAAGYYAYFGAAAGDPREGWYAYDAGSWRVYVLNSNCAEVGGCDAGSPQERWLRQDLAATPRACVLAMWHHPLFSSGLHGNNPLTRPLWRDLYEAGAELVLNGHDHIYERFAAQTPSGRRDPDRGIVEMVVGTGGKSHYEFRVLRDNSLIRDNTTFGVLRLVLTDGGWSFAFLPVAGGTFSDSGTGTCH